MNHGLFRSYGAKIDFYFSMLQICRPDGAVMIFYINEPRLLPPLQGGKCFSVSYATNLMPRWGINDFQLIKNKICLQTITFLFNIPCSVLVLSGAEVFLIQKGERSVS